MIKQQTLSLNELEPYETYENCTLTLPTVQPARISDVTLNHCQLTAGSLAGSEWLDCTLQNLDLSNRAWQQSVIYRSQMVGCQLTGTNFIASTWKDVQVTDCQLDYGNLSEATLTRCRFVTSRLREVYFRAVTVRQGLVFEQCDLNAASFWETTLAGVDLTSSTFAELEVDAAVEKLRRLRINSAQAASLLSLFGVQIKD